jgi:hypothetical protein
MIAIWLSSIPFNILINYIKEAINLRNLGPISRPKDISTKGYVDTEIKKHKEDREGHPLASGGIGEHGFMSNAHYNKLESVEFNATYSPVAQEFNENAEEKEVPSNALVSKKFIEIDNSIKNYVRKIIPEDQPVDFNDYIIDTTKAMVNLDPSKYIQRYIRVGNASPNFTILNGPLDPSFNINYDQNFILDIELIKDMTVPTQNPTVQAYEVVRQTLCYPLYDNTVHQCERYYFFNATGGSATYFSEWRETSVYNLDAGIGLKFDRNTMTFSHEDYMDVEGNNTKSIGELNGITTLNPGDQFGLPFIRVNKQGHVVANGESEYIIKKYELGVGLEYDSDNNFIINHTDYAATDDNIVEVDFDNNSNKNNIYPDDSIKVPYFKFNKQGHIVASTKGSTTLNFKKYLLGSALEYDSATAHPTIKHKDYITGINEGELKDIGPRIVSDTNIYPGETIDIPWFSINRQGHIENSGTTSFNVKKYNLGAELEYEESATYPTIKHKDHLQNESNLIGFHNGYKQLYLGDKFELPWLSVNKQGHITTSGTSNYYFNPYKLGDGLEYKNDPSTNSVDYKTLYHTEYISVNPEIGYTEYGRAKNNGTQAIDVGTQFTLPILQVNAQGHIVGSDQQYYRINPDNKVKLDYTQSGIYYPILTDDSSTSSIIDTGYKCGETFSFNVKNGTLKCSKIEADASACIINASNITAGVLSPDRMSTANISNTGSFGPTENSTLDYSGTFSVPYITVDKYGRVIEASTKTITLPSASSGGGSSYIHPSYTSRSSGLYKISVDNIGHVNEVIEVVKSDITELGIPSENTTYPIKHASLDSTFKTNFRKQTKGDTNNGYYISALRQEKSGVTHSPQHGAGLAFGSADTQGYIAIDYASANSKAYIGGGNGAVLNWTKEIAFTDHIHSSLELNNCMINEDSLGDFTITRSDTNMANIKFTNSNGTLGYIGMTGTANGGLKRLDASNTSINYTILDTGNTSFTQSLTSGTSIGTLTINGKDIILYAPSLDESDDYLPLSGGTVTGQLNIGGSASSTPTLLFDRDTYANWKLISSAGAFSVQTNYSTNSNKLSSYADILKFTTGGGITTLNSPLFDISGRIKINGDYGISAPNVGKELYGANIGSATKSNPVTISITGLSNYSVLGFVFLAGTGTSINGFIPIGHIMKNSVEVSYYIDPSNRVAFKYASSTSINFFTEGDSFLESSYPALYIYAML